MKNGIFYFISIGFFFSCFTASVSAWMPEGTIIDASGGNSFTIDSGSSGSQQMVSKRGSDETSFIYKLKETFSGALAIYEAELGAECDDYFWSISARSKDASLRERVERIGNNVAAANCKDVQFTFEVFEDDSINGSSYPGGHVNISDFAVKSLSDDELAGVIAHEMGHLLSKHWLKEIVFIKGEEEIYKEMEILSSVRSPAAISPEFMAIALDMVNLCYNKQEEFQADSLAVEYTRKAGYDPSGLLSVMRNISDSEEETSPILKVLNDHPSREDRIDRIQEQIDEGRTIKH